MISSSNHNHLFPIFLKLEDLHLLIVGGGPIGLEKLNAVLSNSPAANVTLVAKDFVAEILEKAEVHSKITLKQKTYDSTDLETADLVISAVGDVTLSEKIREGAKEFGLLGNAAYKPSLCDFYLGSVVHKGNLKIAISTNGKSPTVAKRVKEVLNESFPIEIDETLDNLTRIRTYLKGDFTEKVKSLNRITSTLSEKDFKSDALKNKILQCIVGLSFPHC
ncbi:MAG: bifunctional precorrin-2 dehydrogenase/sirohydrochlorin ferrochelatase [Saprospiraceae bacterium]|nr:bifunctional precorrin-2 dehydrogenase/sirohydrochlorin ferrochelatase [Saprospiraceae bacterium]